ncbi:hypothetical protein nbrc107696_45980 [Gordonia spumicola]|uniref:Uncharacterized protein n=1 Tax=Gordonia spumicola TaxID=589161 RepID=A0A7I9V4V3_9ACTN|nr:hypothetical protein [Gordonia spumicola]GEE00223.1 hypothetical protein nbrc107696_06690 [Gordonia spumicola]GEE04152.1 hypothetical protein nbrc107696_45980 [Gordonia spumicola]
MTAVEPAVMSEQAAEAFEVFVDRTVTHAARVCEGMTPLASQEAFAPVLDAWQAFQQAQANHQEDPDV